MRLSIALVFLLIAGSVQAQAPAAGRFLVATTDLEDPNFAKTVLLLLHHDTDGSLAVFVNRPTWVAPSEALPALESSAYAGKVYLGGPVEPAQLLVLLRSPPRGDFQSTVVFDNVYLSTDPELLTTPPFAGATESSVRLYAGHAAWRRGQLDAEIAAGGWRVVEARAEDVFATDPLELWQRLTAPGGELVVDLPRATGR